MNLPFEKLRGQCYNGASAKSSSKCGVAKTVSEHEPQAIYTHRYGHALNLAAGDALKQSKLMKDALETTREITKLIKYSPKRWNLPQDGDVFQRNHSLCKGSLPY